MVVPQKFEHLIIDSFPLGAFGMVSLKDHGRLLKAMIDYAGDMIEKLSESVDDEYYNHGSCHATCCNGGGEIELIGSGSYLLHTAQLYLDKHGFPCEDLEINHLDVVFKMSDYANGLIKRNVIIKKLETKIIKEREKSFKEVNMTELYKDGDAMAISTKAEDESDFIQGISRLFSQMIQDGKFMDDDENDWEFQFNHWLSDIVEICCKFRGYKSNVKETRVITSGSITPSKEVLVATVDSRNNIEYPEEIKQE